MVLQLQLRLRLRPQTLIAALSLALLPVLGTTSTQANEPSGAKYLSDAQKLYQSGDYFRSARYAFAAIEHDSSLDSEGYGWITLGLVRAGMPNAASYFFIRTLQKGNRQAVRRVLTVTQDLLVQLGPDLLRKYLIRHTNYDDYDATNRSAYLYALAKDALLKGQEERAIGYINGMQSGTPLWAFALQLRASAHAIQGRTEDAVRDFQACASKAGKYGSASKNYREADDLKARCLAGEARTLYQMEKFDEADQAYDHIPKQSIVWPDTLFEQAWNSFAKQEYNRSLGKLVSYKSPALTFVYNSEADVLKAQSFLALCLYSDANESINEFNTKYTRLGEEVKRFVERNSGNMNAFYDVGKAALGSSLYTSNAFYRMANRFVRAPYFQNLVRAEKLVSVEMQKLRQYDVVQPGVDHNPDKGFPGFVELVLKWRVKSIRLLGGTFVKNSLMDYHQGLISDFEKMAFIKLEMLKRAKESILYKNRPAGDRTRGNVEPTRKDYQYYWSFNGEFWNDELGDYVFGLESECGK